MMVWVMLLTKRMPGVWGSTNSEVATNNIHTSNAIPRATALFLLNHQRHTR